MQSVWTTRPHSARVIIAYNQDAGQNQNSSLDADFRTLHDLLSCVQIDITKKDSGIGTIDTDVRMLRIIAQNATVAIYRHVREPF